MNAITTLKNEFIKSHVPSRFASHDLKTLKIKNKVSPVGGLGILKKNPQGSFVFLGSGDIPNIILAAQYKHIVSCSNPEIDSYIYMPWVTENMILELHKANWDTMMISDKIKLSSYSHLFIQDLGLYSHTGWTLSLVSTFISLFINNGANISISTSLNLKNLHENANTINKDISDYLYGYDGILKKIMTIVIQPS